MTKLGVLDVGTNSIHLVLAEVEPDFSYKILDRFKERKVGLSVESQYDPNKIQRAAVVLKEYLAERGRQYATVDPQIEQILPTLATKEDVRVAVRDLATKADLKDGLAAVTADMLDEGSGDRSAIEIHEALARLGAQFDTDIGSDATVASVTVLSRFVQRALGLLSDIVVRPSLRESDFARVRQLRLHDVRIAQDDQVVERARVQPIEERAVRGVAAADFDRLVAEPRSNVGERRLRRGATRTGQRLARSA